MNNSLSTVHLFIFPVNTAESLSCVVPCHKQWGYRKEKFSLFMGFMLKEADKKQLTKRFETMVITMKK